jgi:hypothetical protein
MVDLLEIERQTIVPPDDREEVTRRSREPGQIAPQQQSATERSQTRETATVLLV